MKQVTDQIDAISVSADEVEKSSSEMVDKIDSIGTVARDNAEIAGQIAESTGEVRKSMDGIAATTEENSASAEEASASTEEMSAQVEEVVASSTVLAELAEGLKTSVSVFQINEGSGSSKVSEFEEDSSNDNEESEELVA